MKGDDIAERLVAFGVRAIRLTEALPRSTAGKHIGGQFIRSATSAGANYEEARGAESRPDFLHKIGVAWKETREAWYWLRLIHQAGMVKAELLTDLLREAAELSAILGASLRTAKKRSPAS